MTLKVLDLFSGIGGFSLGLERTGGFETVAFCEIESFPRKVLAKHWPDIYIHDDVRTLDGKEYRGAIDVVCGGFPCQDLSVAGKKAGFEGERSSLYGEMLRIVGDCRPRYAIFENVTGLLTGDNGRWFAKFLYDLAKVGYDAEWHCISASELGAHHHRDRVWIIAYPDNDGQIAAKKRKSTKERSGSNKKGALNAVKSSGCRSPCKHENVADSTSQRQQRQREFIKPICTAPPKDRETSIFESMRVRGEWAAESELGRVANGIPDWMDRLKGLGNAVVPQIPEIIGRAILEAEGLTNEQN